MRSVKKYILPFYILVASFSLRAENTKLKIDDPETIEFKAIASKLRCPTCTGISVLGSEASFSQQIKKIVKEKVVKGKSEAEILNFFTERYGAWILRSPPKSGFNLLAWLAPILFLIIGLIVIIVLFWRKKSTINDEGVRSSAVILTQMQEEVGRLTESTKKV